MICCENYLRIIVSAHAWGYIVTPLRGFKEKRACTVEKGFWAIALLGYWA